MRALVPSRRTSLPSGADVLRKQPGVAQELLEPVVELAAHSDFLTAGFVGEFASGGEIFRIPRFVFMGPKSGGDTIRLGIFAAIRGDEPGGTEALVDLLQQLEKSPETALGYQLHAYPICNPTGFATGARNNALGVDLARQFWRGSEEPEVYYLEREMGVHQFQGVISLHDIDSSDFQARITSSILNESVVQPALNAARRLLPEIVQVSGDKVAARHGPLNSIPEGLLTRTDELSRAPFEINLGIPMRATRNSRIQGAVGALSTVLECYRALQATHQNI